jgi:hypothetical protein
MITAALSTASAHSTASEARQAQLEQVVNELFVGEVVTTQRRLELQVTGGVEWHRSREGVAFTPLAQMEFGITDHTEIGVEAPFALVRLPDGSTETALGNVELSILHNLSSNQEHQMALSLGLEAELPATSRLAGDPAIGLNPLLVVYKKFGPVHVNASISAEVGLVALDDEEEGDDADRPAVGARGALSVYGEIGPVVASLEIGGAVGDEPELVVAPGVLWHPAPDVELGAALLYQPLDERAAYGALLMTSWELDLGGDDDAAKAEAARAR